MTITLSGISQSFCLCVNRPVILILYSSTSSVRLVLIIIFFFYFLNNTAPSTPRCNVTFRHFWIGYLYYPFLFLLTPLDSVVLPQSLTSLKNLSKNYVESIQQQHKSLKEKYLNFCFISVCYFLNLNLALSPACKIVTQTKHMKLDS